MSYNETISPPETASSSPTGSPVAWGVAGGLLAGAVVLLAYLGLPLLVTIAAVGLATAASVASVRSRLRKPDGQGETWQDTAAKIAACAKGLELTQDGCSSKFQTLMLNQEQPSNCRIH